MVIETRNISEQIYESLKNKIIKNEFKSGEKISVNQIAKRYGVSYTPVREAIKKLVNDGLIYNMPNKAHIIADISKETLMQVIEIRKMIECYALDKTIKNMNQSIFEDIYNKVKDLQAHGLNNNRKAINFYEIDLDLHKKIVEGAQNKKLLDMYQQVFDVINVVVYKVTQKEHMRDLFANEHLEILESIINKNLRKAKQALSRHIEHSCKYYLESYYYDKIS